MIEYIKWRGFKALGIQTKPFVALQANFVLNSTQLYVSILAIKFPRLPILSKRKYYTFQKRLTENNMHLSLQTD